MGLGFWTDYYASMKEEYNEYLTGYSTSINAAAQHIIDLIDAQKDYGNEYVNQGMRYVGGLQQYLIDAQTINISRAANNAIAAAFDGEVPKDYFALQQSTQAVWVTSLGLQMHALALQLCQSYSYQTTGLFQRCAASSTAPMNPLQQLCYDFSAGVLPSLAPMELDPCGTEAGFIKAANEYLAPYERINNLAQAVNCYVDRVLWEKLDAQEEAAFEFPFVALKVEVFNAPCLPFDPPSFVTNMTSCFTSDCPDPPEGADAVLKCFPASGAECQAFNATLEGGFAEDETCCESRREIFNCTEPPRVEPTYNYLGLATDGYTNPYITADQYEKFVDPQSESWGKLLIQFPTEYMRSQKSLSRTTDEVFVRGIAAYLEGADSGNGQLKVSLTATGEMRNQVRKSGEELERESCQADSCMFDDYAFTGAPSGQAYDSNADNTVTYTATYWNVNSATGECDIEATLPVFTATKKAQGTLETDRLYYCTNADFEQTYQNSYFVKNDPTGPYNSASLFTNFELSVTGDGSPVGHWGIDLRGVTAIHIGFWLKTTEADEGQCSKMCDATFTGDECKGVNDIMKQQVCRNMP